MFAKATKINTLWNLDTLAATFEEFGHKKTRRSDRAFNFALFIRRLFIGTAGIEPATLATSRRCSPTELPSCRQRLTMFPSFCIVNNLTTSTLFKVVFLIIFFKNLTAIFSVLHRREHHSFLT